MGRPEGPHQTTPGWGATALKEGASSLQDLALEDSESGLKAGATTRQDEFEEPSEVTSLGSSLGTSVMGISCQWEVPREFRGERRVHNFPGNFPGSFGDGNFVKVGIVEGISGPQLPRELP